VVRWVWYVVCMGEMRIAHSILVENLRHFRRPRHRYEDNIRMDLWEIGWEGVD